MLFYEILTWWIIKLSDIRFFHLKKYHWRTGFTLRKDREMRLKDHKLRTNGLEFRCCDCGLVHFLFIDGDDCIHFIPLRPKDYRYRLRASKIEEWVRKIIKYLQRKEE